MKFKSDVDVEAALAVSGDVGVGTTSPSFGTGGGLQISNAAQANLRFTDTSSATFITDLALSNENFYLINRSASGSLKFRVNSSNEALTILSSGNVGIGTTSPSYKLDVAGNIRVDSTSVAQIFLDSAASNDAVLNFHENASQKGKIGYDTSLGGIALVAGSGAFSTADMVLLDGGNVGIGTTSPTTTLDVRGDIKAEGANTPTISVKDTTNDLVGRLRAANSYVYLTADHGDTVNSSRIVFQVDGDSSAYVTNGLFAAETSVQFTTYGSGTETGTAAYALAVDSSGNVIETAVQGSPTGGSGTAGKITKWDTSSTLTDSIIAESNGRIGIGTTSPDRQLQVHESTSGTSTAKFTNSTTGEDGDTGFFVGINGSEQPILYGYNNTDMIIGTSGSERMRITSAGNVGIGDSGPNVKLQVSTSSPTNNVAVSIGDGWVGNDLYHKEGGLLLISGTSQDSTQTGAGLAFQTRNTQNTNYWKSSIIMDRDGAMRFTLGGAGTVQGSEDLTIISGGNVGIGASSPLRKLHVVGNFAVNAGTGEYYGVNITGGEGANPTILIGDWHNASANLSWDSTNRLLRIDAQYSTNGAPIVFSGNDAAIEYGRFTATGNFGIGTTNPGEKLTVNGKILLENSGTPIFTLKDTGNSGGGGASGIIRFKNNAGDAIGIGYTSNDTTTSDLLISTNAASTYGGYLGLDANAITDSSSIILDPKTSVIINGDAVIGEHRIIDLPSFNMGAGSVTDEYLVVCKQAPSGGGVVASGIQGRISFSRGSDGSYNNSHYIDINIQMSLDSGSVNTLDVTQFELYRDSSNPFFSQLEEIDIDGTKYVALKARSSGGGSVNHFYFEGSISDASDTNILSRVRASDSAVTVTDPQPTGLPITPYITKNQDGNVGIGTTSPTLSPTSYTGGLHVENDTYIQARLSSSSSGAGLEFIPSSGDHWEIQAQTGNSLIFYNRTDSSYRMVIDGGGNIGVGITLPAAKMHIGPAALVSGYTTTRTTLAVSDTTNGAELILRGQSPRIWLDATAGGDGEIYMDGTNLVVYAGNPTSAGDSRFSIDSSGNIRFAAYTAGYLKSDASGNITVDTSTIEDTLDSVTDRGATTTNDISVGAITLTDDPASSNGTFVKVYEDTHKRMYTANLDFSFTAAGTYNFNLVFANSGGYQYELTAVNSRNGLYRNFGTLKDSSYIYWESDEDFTHRAEGDVHLISSLNGGMYFSADTTYFLSDGVTDTQQTGTANWSYAIIRYSVYIPYYVGDTTGSWKLHLTTYGDTGSSTPQFVLA